MNYDPNLTNCGRMADQIVRLTFACWEYRKTMEVSVGGNCTGLSVIESAVSNAWEELPNVPGCLDMARIVLVNEKGDTLECDDEFENGEDWLKDMLIAAEIISITPEAGKGVKP